MVVSPWTSSQTHGRRLSVSFSSVTRWRRPDNRNVALSSSSSPSLVQLYVLGVGILSPWFFSFSFTVQFHIIGENICGDTAWLGSSSPPLLKCSQNSNKTLLLCWRASFYWFEGLFDNNPRNQSEGHRERERFSWFSLCPMAIYSPER